MTTELTLKQSLQKVTYQPSPAPHRVNLKVPFADKDRAKAIGAKWDNSLKTWYIDVDADLKKFRLWMH